MEDQDTEEKIEAHKPTNQPTPWLPLRENKLLLLRVRYLKVFVSKCLSYVPPSLHRHPEY